MLSDDSLERVHQYLSIEQEPKGGDIPPAYWPSSGSLRVEKLSARYSTVGTSPQSIRLSQHESSQDGPKILQDLSFEIKSGERVGIGSLPISPIITRLIARL